MTLTLLISRQGRERHGERIEAVLKGTSCRYIHLEDEPDRAGLYAADIAFMTRDVTGDSTKAKFADTLLRFYEIMRASPALRWMQTHSAGADRPIYPELRKRGVTVTTASGANAKPVAQMAVAGLLALGRRLPELMDAQRRHAWEPLLGSRAPVDLHEQAALIVGLGPIGLEIARLLKALGMRVIGVRRQMEAVQNVDDVVTFDALRAALPRADWLILACPLSDITRGLLDAAAIDLLPRGARVINVSRGEVVVESDLVTALQTGRLGGAFLDVLVKEPLEPASPLWSLPNVVVTPHTAGHTAGLAKAIGEIFLDNLVRWRQGRTLRNEIA
jgi:phosphoglycerate dehydrogenase-like enzyme